MYDILIIGGGTAGMSAGIYAKRSGLNVLVIESNVPGGQIVNTPDVENYPGILKTTGFEFAMKLMEQLSALDVEIMYDQILDYDLKSDIKKLTFADKTIEGKTIIIANGVNRRELGCEGEDKFKGSGVSYCATCDGAFYKDKDVAIVGGGNTALEDALFLANNCKTVYLVHRRDEFRGNKILVDAVLKRENIKVLYNSQVISINGDKVVSSVTIDTSGQAVNYDVSGIFIAVGLIPSNEVFRGVIDLDEGGYIKASEDLLTNVPGVFVAGDTRTKLLRQLITAASDGAIAAVQAAMYLN
ncbi:MAG: FAD-dependent oxidoreductase [Clostridia bacterium]